MPVRSKAQQAFLAIHHPDVLAKWKAEGAKTSPKGLPYHVEKEARRKKPKASGGRMLRGGAIAAKD